MDSKYVQLPGGKTVFQFGAIDCFTRKRVVDLAPSLTSEEGARFLNKVISGFPFPVQAIQSDGGAEFLGDFTKTVAELRLTHYFNRPYYPQGNGRIERSFRTDDDEFYHVRDLPADFSGLQTALLAWNRRYESWRPAPSARLSHPRSVLPTMAVQTTPTKGGGVRYVLTQHNPLTLHFRRSYSSAHRQNTGASPG